MRGPANGRRYREFGQMIGFSGELHESGMGWQLLGNGRRTYNPKLMRFHSPDRLSPFDRGGINAYAYCSGNPVDHVDPTGGFALPLLMMGVGVAMGAGAGALASPPSSGRKGDSDGAMAWIIGGATVGAVVIGLGLMAGKAGVWNTVLPKRGKAPSQSMTSTSSITPGTSTPSNAALGQNTWWDGSKLYEIDIKHIFKNPAGNRAVDIKNLHPKVVERIVQVRDYSVSGRTPDPSRVPRGDRFKNFEEVLPPRPTQKNMYWEYAIGDDRSAGQFARTRLVTARGRPREDGKPRIGVMRVTTGHYKDFVVVEGWRDY
jgi:RHS repeat-associated protein